MAVSMAFSIEPGAGSCLAQGSARAPACRARRAEHGAQPSERAAHARRLPAPLQVAPDGDSAVGEQGLRPGSADGPRSARSSRVAGSHSNPTGTASLLELKSKLILVGAAAMQRTQSAVKARPRHSHTSARLCACPAGSPGDPQCLVQRPTLFPSAPRCFHRSTVFPSLHGVSQRSTVFPSALGVPLPPLTAAAAQLPLTILRPAGSSIPLC